MCVEFEAALGLNPGTPGWAIAFRSCVLAAVPSLLCPMLACMLPVFTARADLPIFGCSVCVQSDLGEEYLISAMLEQQLAVREVCIVTHVSAGQPAVDGDSWCALGSEPSHAGTRSVGLPVGTGQSWTPLFLCTLGTVSLLSGRDWRQTGLRDVSVISVCWFQLNKLDGNDQVNADRIH